MNESMPVSTFGALTLHPASSSEQDKKTSETDNKTHVSKTNNMTAVKLIPENIESTEETEARASRASIASKTRSVQALESTPAKTKAIIV